jgi:hypothetical protein
MNDIRGLAQELLAIESETFEIDDFDGADMATFYTSSTSSTSSCA